MKYIITFCIIGPLAWLWGAVWAAEMFQQIAIRDKGFCVEHETRGIQLKKCFEVREKK